MSRKRAHDGFLADDLHIKFADPEAGPLAADRVIMSNFSTCVRGLPADATVWDLSQLVVEGGQAVQRATVVTWLNAAYRVTEDEVFEEQPNPPKYMSEFAQLLAFADAVGTSKGLLRVLCSGFQLRAEVKVAEAVYILDLSASHRWLTRFRLCTIYGGSSSPAAVCSSQQERAAVEQQVVQQLETLLYLAYKLQLEGLQKQLRRVIMLNSSKRVSLLSNCTSGLASERVQAAAGSSTLAFVNSLIMQPLTFGPAAGLQQLLEPVNIPTAQRVALGTKFNCRVLQDFLDLKAGDEVAIELDLLQLSNISFTARGVTHAYPVRLMLGQESAGGWPV